MMPEPAKNVLIIAYYFPPLGGSGALRPLKLVKHLPSFGWNPVVITVKNPDWYYAHDPQLLNELPPEVSITRCLMLKGSWFYRILNPLRVGKWDNWLKRYLFHPDDHLGWLPFAYHCSLRAVQEKNIKVIYSTSGPMTCHLIAYCLKRKTGLPWVAEFRDEWLEDPSLNLPTRFHYKLHFQIEKLVVKNADRVVGMAPVYCELLSKHMKNCNKFLTVTGGFDSEDRKNEHYQKITKSNKSKLIISFIGLFYPTFRPNLLLQAVTELISDEKISSNEFEIQFIGANSPKDMNYTDKFGVFKFKGYVPRNQALSYLYRSDILLLLLSEQRGKDVIPSKIFEYMISDKPILALVPPGGAVADIIRKTKTGVVAAFDDVEEIKGALLRFYNRWKRGDDLKPDSSQNEIAKYEFKNLTSSLARVFCEIIK